MTRTHLLLLTLPLFACSTAAPTPTSGEPAAEVLPAASAAEPSMSMPAGGSYLALDDPSYGYLKMAAHAPAPGATAPDFELPTHTGERLRLSAALEQGPVVLMFYRGFW